MTVSVCVYEGNGKGRPLGSWHYSGPGGKVGGGYASQDIATKCAIRDVANGDASKVEIVVRPADYPEWWEQPRWGDLKTDEQRRDRIRHWYEHHKARGSFGFVAMPTEMQEWLIQRALAE